MVKLDFGFNIIKNDNPEIFTEKISIIQFLKDLSEGIKFPDDFAVTGLDSLIYFSADKNDVLKYIRRILQDNANNLILGNYIIQIVIDGDIQIISSPEKPRIIYKEKVFDLYSIFGRVKQIDLKHFLAPLNLQS